MTSTVFPKGQDVDRSELPRVPEPTPPGKKRGLIWLILLLIVGSVVGYAVWRASKPQAPQRAQQGGGPPRRGGGGAGLGPIPVVVTTVSRTSIPEYLNGLGNVTAFYTVTVKSRVDGQFMKADFNEGDYVKQGQTLVELDPRQYQVQLDLAQAALAHDQAASADSKIDLGRYQKLFDEGVIPRQQLDSQIALVGGYEGTLKQDAANIENAKLNLVYAKITAPITGIVGLRLVDPGNIIHATDATGIVVITQLQPISVLFTIPEDSLPEVAQKLRAGMHMPVDAFNRDNSKLLASGKLITLDNQINNTTGTSTLKAVFDNKDFALFPQQFVNIRLLVDTLQDQLVVPNVAIQNGQQGTFVYTVDNRSKVHIRPVQVGITTATSADVLSGISDGDRVVVAGTDRLSEGAEVRVRRPGELDNPAGAVGGRRRNRGGANGSDGNSNGGQIPNQASGNSNSAQGNFNRGDGNGSPNANVDGSSTSSNGISNGAASGGFHQGQGNFNHRGAGTETQGGTEADGEHKHPGGGDGSFRKHLQPGSDSQ
jgi:multidrug efflux system membrane fusion protein